MPLNTAVPTSMRASVLYGVRDVRMEERATPMPAPDEVVVRVHSVGVCGSDVHYYNEGRIADFVVTAPLILGHECSGVIVAVGDAVDPDRVGQRVAIEPQRCCRTCEYCRSGRYNLCRQMEFYATPPIDGSFCDFVTIQSDFAFEIPESMSFDAGALIEPLSVGVAAQDKMRIGPGDSLLIAGCGPIGILCMMAALGVGVRQIVMTDIDAGRRAKAIDLGASAAYAPGAPELAPLRFDGFIDATGVGTAIVDGIMQVAPGGTVVLVGMGTDHLELPVAHIANSEITLTGVFRYVNTWPRAIEMASTGLFSLDQLVTDVYPLEVAETALAEPPSPSTLKRIIRVNQGA